MNIPIEEIIVGKRLRVAGDVTALADSIKDIGLLNPITVTKDKKLVAGAHRLKAFKQLGRKTIPAVYVTLDELDRELAEIDENLIRNELTQLEQSLQIDRRKEIYEIKHPETRKGAQGGGRNGKGTRTKTEKPTIGFSVDTAQKTGKALSTIKNKAAIGKKLKKKAAKIKGTAIEDSQKDLLMLAKIKDEEKQDAIIEKIVSGEAKNVTEAARQVKADEAGAERLEAAATIEIPDNIIVGDFWENANKVADGSLALIFTDPPYSKEAEIDIEHLAKFAANKLARGGSVLFYVGHLQLPAAFKAFDGKLRHWWTCACVHAGGKDLMVHYGVRVGWKPMLWFVKESRLDTQNIVMDTVSGATEKDRHEWQQAEQEALYWIEKLCPADGIVCDPFLGSGTTAAAAKKLNRQWVGFEKKPETALDASERLEGGNDQTV